MLQTAGVPAQQIPDGLDLRAGLWRDHVAGKRLLLVLDDAAGHDQIRHLLPGTAGALVLITTRRHLTALEDAKVISLGSLPPGDADALLVRLADRAGPPPEKDAVRRITELCGYLPLAVGMLARQLHHHPAWTAADLAADLAAARDRLALMRAENLSVAAAFDLSYQELTPGGQQLFRRLGLHPGTDIDAYAAAARDSSDLTTAHRNLADLYDHYLLNEPAHGRYRMHDLIAEHARGLAAGHPDADRDAAMDRFLDYYLHTASTASRLIPWRTSIAGPSSPGPPPDRAPEEQALQLFREVNDRRGQAWALNEEGIAQRRAGNYPAASANLTQARNLFREIGDRQGQAQALLQLGAVQQLTGDPQAAASLIQAQQLFHDLGDRYGGAEAASSLSGLLSPVSPGGANTSRRNGLIWTADCRGAHRRRPTGTA